MQTIRRTIKGAIHGNDDNMDKDNILGPRKRL